MNDNEPLPLRNTPSPSTPRHTHPCRADLDREEDRALAALRSPRRGEDLRPPSQRRQLHAKQHLRVRPLGLKRLWHLSSHGWTLCVRSRSAQSLPDITIRSSGRRDPTARRQLAEGRTRAALHRHDRGARHRSGRRRAGILWRHLHNRLAAGHQPRAYTREQHAAWLKRRIVSP